MSSVRKTNTKPYTNKNIKDIMLKFDSLKGYFSRHNLLSEDINLQDHPSLLNTSLIFKHSNYKNQPPVIEPCSSGNESEEDTENTSDPSVKDVVESIYDLNKIRIIASSKDFPDKAQPGILLFGIDESMNAIKLKPWLEDSITKGSWLINEIQQIRIFKYNDKKSCFLSFSVISDAEDFYNILIKKFCLVNAKGEPVKFALAYDSIELKNSFWYAVVIRNLPANSGSEKVQTFCTERLKSNNIVGKILYCLPPEEIKKKLCAVVVTENLSEAESLCSLLNKKEIGKNYVLKVHLHPLSCKIRKEKNSLYYKYYCEMNKELTKLKKASSNANTSHLPNKTDSQPGQSQPNSKENKVDINNLQNLLMGMIGGTGGKKSDLQVTKVKEESRAAVPIVEQSEHEIQASGDYQAKKEESKEKEKANDVQDSSKTKKQEKLGNNSNDPILKSNSQLEVEKMTSTEMLFRQLSNSGSGGIPINNPTRNFSQEHTASSPKIQKESDSVKFNPLADIFSMKFSDKETKETKENKDDKETNKSKNKEPTAIKKAESKDQGLKSNNNTTEVPRLSSSSVNNANGSKNTQSEEKKEYSLFDLFKNPDLLKLASTKIEKKEKIKDEKSSKDYSNTTSKATRVRQSQDQESSKDQPLGIDKRDSSSGIRNKRSYNNFSNGPSDGNFDEHSMNKPYKKGEESKYSNKYYGNQGLVKQPLKVPLSNENNTASYKEDQTNFSSLPGGLNPFTLNNTCFNNYSMILQQNNMSNLNIFFGHQGQLNQMNQAKPGDAASLSLNNTLNNAFLFAMSDNTGTNNGVSFIKPPFEENLPPQPKYPPTTKLETNKNPEDVNENLRSLLFKNQTGTTTLNNLTYGGVITTNPEQVKAVTETFSQLVGNVPQSNFTTISKIIEEQKEKAPFSPKETDKNDYLGKKKVRSESDNEKNEGDRFERKESNTYYSGAREDKFKSKEAYKSGSEYGNKPRSKKYSENEKSSLDRDQTNERDRERDRERERERERIDKDRDRDRERKDRKEKEYISKYDKFRKFDHDLSRGQKDNRDSSPLYKPKYRGYKDKDSDYLKNSSYKSSKTFIPPSDLRKKEANNISNSPSNNSSNSKGSNDHYYSRERDREREKEKDHRHTNTSSNSSSGKYYQKLIQRHGSKILDMPSSSPNEGRYSRSRNESKYESKRDSSSDRKS